MKTHFLPFCAGVLCLALALTSCQSAVTAGSAPSAPSSEAAASSVPAASADTRPLSIACTSAGMNPYLTDDTITQQNASLLFEPLIFLTPDLDIDYRLAQSINNSGTQVILQIRSGCYFADGTEITAEDALASLQAARVSTLYASRFSNIAALSVEGSAVIVTLNTPDSLFAYLLDIPVLRADETGVMRPTPSGRYTYGSNDASLVKNSRAAFPDDGPDSISLVTVAGTDELVSGLAVGTVDLYVQNDGSSETTSINALESYYRTNSLIYLGVNSGSSNPLCASAEGRQLLSALTSRNDLASKAYYSRAYAATGTINSYYPCVKGRQTILASTDTASLESTMALLGYSKDTASGYYQDAKGVPASVSLLVYSQNSYKRYTAQLLQSQWQACGIRVDLTETDNFDDYISAVQSNQFELYIGEVKLYNNIDLSPFWSGNARYGLALSGTLLSAYDAFRQNVGTAGDFEAAFAAEMPFVPLLWHSGTVVTSRRVSGVAASPSSAFYSLSSLQIG